MEEIKVGEYVRTRDGRIFKVKQINEGYLIEDIEYGGLGCFIEYAVKHSFNIIDLIEVEDIVKVKDHDWIRVFNIDDKITLKSFIEDCEENNWTLMSIVTKEQFQSVEYRLEE